MSGGYRWPDRLAGIPGVEPPPEPVEEWAMWLWVAAHRAIYGLERESCLEHIDIGGSE